jgi:peptidoglycan/xylan/chitin deacetylase (PgdA/CDA1 family)
MIARLQSAWRKNWPEWHAALRGGFPPFVLRDAPLPTGLVPVFCFHTVERDAFRTAMEHLRGGGHCTLPADAVVAHMQGASPAPAGAVALTFDDGAANLYDTVFPVLRDLGLCATAFVCPPFHPAAAAAPPPGDRVPPPCTVGQLREMDASGCVRIESHTFSHRYLPRYPQTANLVGVGPGWTTTHRPAPTSVPEELRAAQAALTEWLGRPVRHLAFPQYDGTNEAVAAGRALGYAGFWWGVHPGQPGNRVGDDPARIVRISGEFVERLPGPGRRTLRDILRARWRR